MKGTIVFIHGAWMTPKCWEKFAGFFEARGYRAVAPAWPGKEGSVEDVRLHAKERLRGLGIVEIVESYADVIRALPEPPIIIGHSFGGLFTEMLLDRGLGRGGIAIDAAPPKGVFSFYPSVVRGMGKVLLAWKGWKKVFEISRASFTYAFVHTLSPDMQRHVYANYVVPETGRIFWQAALAPVNDLTRVDFANPVRPPLLIIAGSRDRTIPARMNKDTFAKYKKLSQSNEPLDFHEFPDRTHWIIGQDGWEEIAEYCLDWIENLQK